MAEQIEKNIIPDSKEKTITFLRDLAKGKNYLNSSQLEEKQKEAIKKFIDLWNSFKNLSSDNNNLLWYISILEKSLNENKAIPLGTLNILINDLYKIDASKIDDLLKNEIYPLLEAKHNNIVSTITTDAIIEQKDVNISTRSEAMNLALEVSENPWNKAKEKAIKLFTELSKISSNYRADEWLDVSDLWWNRPELKTKVSEFLTLIWKDPKFANSWEVLSLQEISDWINSLNQRLDELDKINSYIEWELKDLKEKAEKQMTFWLEEDKTQKSKDTIEPKWWTKTRTFWIENPFMTNETNDYMKSSQIRSLLRNIDSKEQSQLLYKIEEVMGKKWISDFREYTLKDLFSEFRLDNYSKELNPIIKGYLTDWEDFSWAEMALLVDTLRRYVYMQEERIPQLNEEQALEVLLDEDKDSALRSSTKSVSWTEYGKYSSIFKSINNADKNQLIQNLIKNLWFSNFYELKKEMQNNLFLTRELFQGSLNSLSFNWLDINKLLDKDILNKKIEKQVEEINNWESNNKNRMKNTVSMWILKYVWSKFSIEWIPDFIKLPDDGKRMYESLLSKLEPMYVWVNYWLDSWLSWSASYPTPKLISDFLNEVLIPDWISWSIWKAWLTISLNKGLFKEFLSKYDTWLTLTLINCFMPVLTANKWFDISDLWEIKSMFQEKSEKTWFKWNFYASVSPFTKTLNIWVNIWIEDGDTSAWIEKMTIKASTYFEKMWESILKGEKAEVFIAKFDWSKKDILAYNHIKSTFDNVTKNLETKDKETYMKKLFMKWYVDSLRTRLYELSSKKPVFNSFWVWVSNTFWEAILWAIKDSWKESIENIITNFWKDIDVSFLWIDNKNDTNNNTNNNTNDNLNNNNKPFWFSDLIISWWLNPVPYISIWWEYKTVDYVPVENHREQYYENMRRISIDEVWKRWDVKIWSFNNMSTLSVNPNFLTWISSNDWNVQSQRSVEDWRLHIWWFNLSDFTFYERIDKEAEVIWVLWEWQQNSSWDFKLCNYSSLENWCVDDTWKMVNYTNSITNFTPKIDVLWLWWSVSFEWIEKYAKENEYLWITKKDIENFNKSISELSKTNFKDIENFPKIISEIVKNNFLWFKDWNIDKNDLKQIKSILDTFVKNNLSLEKVSKIDIIELTKATWAKIDKKFINPFQEWLDKINKSWENFESIIWKIDLYENS